MKGSEKLYLQQEMNMLRKPGHIVIPVLISNPYNSGNPDYSENSILQVQAMLFIADSKPR